MLFKVIITVNDEELNALECHLYFHQATDYNGEPTTQPGGDIAHIVVGSGGAIGLFDRIISGRQTRDEVITFLRRDTYSRLKELRSRMLTV
ncbi:MAG TPA: type VI secretion system tube protein TssD [Chitinophaga sp.]|uniref:type VI secretion system tube protein TssD n=1 Tax=Chitinophaga sp. TaxID=1869181 RepID=UPI002B62A5ED|nr:type VI secretion system tube protein TssD [Chitinophaga sp.]HVI43612.1 type VI secretion system tube protein TssD [Chitinophaga sp.]